MSIVNLSDYLYYETELGKVYKGDCLDILLLFEDKQFDLCLTDPPYNQSAKGGGCFLKRKSFNKLVNSDFNNFNPIEFLNILKKTLPIFHLYIYTSKDLLNKYIDFFQENNFNWDILTLSKNNPIPTKNNCYLSDKEFCFFVREKGKCYFNNNLEYKNYYTVKKINVKPSQYGHPTEKNIKVIQSQIQISTKINDLIIDPFAGSGTLGVACECLNRRYILIEKEEKYCKIIKHRIKNESDQYKMFKNEKLI